MPFKCSGCGLCCKNIGATIEFAILNPEHPLAAGLKDFPYKVTAEGSCSMLTSDNKCSVYDHRPDVCNVDKSKDIYAPHITQQSWYELNEKACKKLQSNVMDCP